jgi:large subunit ribosomal protein L13
MKTFVEKKENQKMEWYLIDANNLILGRIATQIANILRGKHKPTFTPHLTGATGVVVVNIDKIKVTGNKETKKKYFHHTGYPGGGKLINYETHAAKDPAFPLRKAVERMLPKNRLQAVMMTRLKMYVGATHPHEAQKLITYTVKGQES